MMIVQATHKFERWLTQQTAVVRMQLSEKHRRMAESPLIFLRGTIYRWSQMWPEVCPELARAPHVLAIGDLHIDSFGPGAMWLDGSSGERMTSTKRSISRTRRTCFGLT